MSVAAPQSRVEQALDDYARRHWRQLVRFCAYLSGERAVAEDLAQETLIEAWRARERLHDVEALPRWVASVARNVCLRRRRARGQERLREAMPLDALDAGGGEPVGATSDTGDDFALDLDRDQLAALLDQALRLLTPRTRAVVLARLLDGTPQAEVALRMGLSEGAVALRLLRGRLALRRALAPAIIATQEATDSAMGASGWRETGIWCLLCGQRRLEGRLDLARQELILRCPSCDHGSTAPFCHHLSHQRLFDGVSGLKPAYSRLLRWGGVYYGDALRKGHASCQHCGRPAPLFKGLPGESGADGENGLQFFHIACASCGYPTNNASLDFLLLARPEAQRYWREHPRVRRFIPRAMEAQGRPALLAGFGSMTDSSRLEAIVARDTFDVLSVHIS